MCRRASCGFRGVALTGWCVCAAEEIAKHQADGLQVSVTDDGTFVRYRVRQLDCPRCHQRSLTRIPHRLAVTGSVTAS